MRHTLKVELSKRPSEINDYVRLTVLLRYFSACSCVQIAEYLELPVGTITKRLSRAHLLLREELNKRTTRAEAER